MPLQPLVRLPPLKLPRPLPPQLPAVVEDRDLLVLVKVTRVDLLQLLIPLTSDSLTVAEDAEISGRSGRTSG
jgi:hypothetical protein